MNSVVHPAMSSALRNPHGHLWQWLVLPAAGKTCRIRFWQGRAEA